MPVHPTGIFYQGNRMEITIIPARVAQAVAEVNRLIAGKGFNSIELIFALSEMTGRMVVSAAEGPIQAKELAGVAFAHLSKTITIGMGAQKDSVIERL